MTSQFEGNSADKLAEIEQTIAEFGGGGEGTFIRWLIEEVKRLREANVILTYGIQRIGTHDVQLITARAGDCLARAVAAMKGEVSS